MANKQITINMAFTADTSKAKAQLEALKKDLQQLSGKQANSEIPLTNQLKQATDVASKLKIVLAGATSSTGTLDLTKFTTGMKKAGLTIEECKQQLRSLGAEGDKAFLGLAQSVMSAEVPLKKSSVLADKLWVSLKNTFTWRISTSFLNSVIGSIQKAYYFAEDLNESLNNIRIVTGYSADYMEKFAIQANKAAKALHTTTTAYTDASLIYFQQGLNDNEVQKRTETTLKLANVTGESASTVSEQLTSVWNNFAQGSENLEYYVDVMAKLGAITASSSDEIAEGLEKFASTASTVGLSYEYAAAALATVTANTRESASVVGNAFKTLFSRIEGLKLGETLDDGVTLNKYSQALANVGVNVLDTSSNLKEMDEILDQTAVKWKNLDKAQQVALAETVGGAKQYTQFIALMENWEDFQKNVVEAKNSTGTLQEQADIYAESWEAARKNVQASLENIYQKLLDDKFFIKFTNDISKLIDKIGLFIDSLGGVKGVLFMLGSTLTQVFGTRIIESFTNSIQNMVSLIPAVNNKIEAKLMQEKRNTINSLVTNSGNSDLVNNSLSSLGNSYLLLYENAKKLSPVEAQIASSMLNQQKALSEQVIDAESLYNQSKKELQNISEKKRIKALEQTISTKTQQYNSIVETTNKYSNTDKVRVSNEIAKEQHEQNKAIEKARYNWGGVSNKKKNGANFDELVSNVGGIQDLKKIAGGNRDFLDQLEYIENKHKKILKLKEQYSSIVESENKKNSLEQLEKEIKLAEDKKAVIQKREQLTNDYKVESSKQSAIDALSATEGFGNFDEKMYSKNDQEIQNIISSVEQLKLGYKACGESMEEALGPEGAALLSKLEKELSNDKISGEELLKIFNELHKLSYESQQKLDQIEQNYIENYLKDKGFNGDLNNPEALSPEQRTMLEEAREAWENYKNTVDRVNDSKQNSIQISGRQMQSEQELAKKVEEAAKARAASSAAGFQNLSSAIMSAFSAYSSITNAIQVFNDESSTNQQKTSTIIGLITMAIPLVTNAGRAISVLGKKAVIAGVTTKIAWGWIYLAIAVIAGLAVSLIKHFKNLKAASPEGQLKAAQEEAEKLKTAIEETKTASDEMLESFNKYNSIVEGLEDLKKGTEAFTAKLIEANNAAFLLRQQLSGYISEYQKETGKEAFLIKDGVMTFTEDFQDWTNQKNSEEILLAQAAYAKSQEEIQNREIDIEANKLLDSDRISYGEGGSTSLLNRIISRKKRKVSEEQKQQLLEEFSQAAGLWQEGDIEDSTLIANQIESSLEGLGIDYEEDEVVSIIQEIADDWSNENNQFANLYNKKQETEADRQNDITSYGNSLITQLAILNGNSDISGILAQDSALYEATLSKAEEIKKNYQDENGIYKSQDILQAYQGIHLGQTYSLEGNTLQYQDEDGNAISISLEEALVDIVNSAFLSIDTLGEDYANIYQSSVETAEKSLEETSKTAIKSIEEAQSGYAEINKITKELQHGDTLSAEDYNTLGDKYANYFTKTATGEYQLTGSAEELKRKISENEIEALSSNLGQHSIEPVLKNDVSPDTVASYISNGKNINELYTDKENNASAEIRQQTVEQIASYATTVKELDNYLTKAKEMGATDREIVIAKGKYLPMLEEEANSLALDAKSISELNSLKAKGQIGDKQFASGLANIATKYASCQKALNSYNKVMKESPEDLQAIKDASDNLQLAVLSAQTNEAAQKIANVKTEINQLSEAEKNLNNAEYSEKLYSIAEEINNLYGTNVSASWIEDNMDLVNDFYQGVEGSAQKLATAALQGSTNLKEVIRTDLEGILEDEETIQAVADTINNIDLNMIVNGEMDATELFSTLMDLTGDLETAKSLVEKLTGTKLNLKVEYDTSSVAQYNSLLAMMDPNDPNKNAETVRNMGKLIGIKSIKIEDATSTAPDAENGLATTIENNKKSKTLKTADDENERYYEISRIISNLQRTYSKLSEAKDRAYGKERLKNIEDEIELLNKEKEAQQKLLDQAKAFLSTDESTLKSYFANYSENPFNSEGIVTQQARDWLAQQLAYAENSDSDSLNQWAEKAKNALSQYDETLQKVAEVKDNLIDLDNQVQDLNYEKITYKIELRTEINENDLQSIEMKLESMGDNIFKAVEKLAYIWNGDTLTNTQYNRYIEQLTIAKEAINDVRKAKEEGLISDEAYISNLNEQQSAIVSAISSLRELKNTMESYYSDTMSSVNEELEKYNSRLEHSTSILQAYKKILDLTGYKADYEKMSVLLNGIVQTSKNSYQAKAEEYKMWESQRIEADKAMAQYEKELAEAQSTEEKEIAQRKIDAYKKTYDAIIENSQSAYDAMISSAEAYAEAINEKFENAITKASKKLEDLSTNDLGYDGMSNSLTRLSEISDEYLTKTNQLYETITMLRDITKDISKTQSASSKVRLNNFAQEIKNMQQQSQLSQLDLKIAKARYSILQAQIALEEAKEAKSTVRRVRDSEGNYSYVYTTDLDKISQAEQNVADAENELYNLSLENYNNYAQKILQTRKDYAEAMTELEKQFQNGEIESIEEYNDKKALIQKEFEDKLYIYTQNFNTARGVLNETALTDYSEAYSSTYDDILSDSTIFNNDMLSFISEIEDAQQTASNELKDLVEDVVEPSLEGIKNATDEVTTSSNELLKKLEGESGLVTQFNNLANTVHNSTLQWIEQDSELQKVITDYENLYGLITEIKAQSIGLERSYSTDGSDQDYSALMMQAYGEGNLTDYEKYEKMRIDKIALHGVDVGNATTENIDYVISTLGLDTFEAIGKFLGKTVTNWTSSLTNEDWNKLLGKTVGKTIKDTDIAIGTGVNTISSNTKDDSQSDNTTRYENIKKLHNSVWSDKSYPIGLTNRIARAVQDGYTEEEMRTVQDIINKYWPNKASEEQIKSFLGFASGGYTGEWGDSGKLAILHQKELVLNAQDTENILTSVNLLRSIIDVLDAKTAFAMSNLSSVGYGGTSQSILSETSNLTNSNLNQSVTIHAEFPNATNHSEIEQAFDNLINEAAQYAFRHT